MLGASPGAILIVLVSDKKGGFSVARILITTEPGRAPGGSVVFDERIVTSDLDSGHFASRLIERIGWALADADDVDRIRGS
jgi:hypothetical protein